MVQPRADLQDGLLQAQQTQARVSFSPFASKNCGLFFDFFFLFWVGFALIKCF